ncbi:MAG: 50S ribosomal protein L18 [Alphaproteobacteria bacterium]|jgi:large subunit ribosomal protein L18|nr:50S ribosomal protein L18 [Alphaproteobacteria bacterium]
MDARTQRFQRRRDRVRYKVREHGRGRPRLSVHRTNEHIYAQIIDDGKGETVASASTLEVDMRKALKTGADKDAATKIGALIAERAKAKGITEVVFDRGGFIFHGRVKALADAAREAGLKF